MRSKSRVIAVLSILNAGILMAGVTGAVSLRGDQASQASGEGGEPAPIEQGAAESESPSTAETTAPPPTPDLTPEGIAESAASTLQQSARFTMRLDQSNFTWKKSEAPVRSTDFEGVMDGDRLHFTMEADYPFPRDNPRFAFRESKPTSAVFHAWEVARTDDPTISVSRLGSDLWICGVRYFAGCWQLPDMETWEPHPDWQMIESLRSYVLGVIPFMHLEALRGATDVIAAEEVELDGIPVHHVSGTLTLEGALTGIPAATERELRWWFRSLGVYDLWFDQLWDKPYPFEVWIDSDGIIRRAIVSLSLDAIDLYTTQAALTETGYQPDDTLISTAVTMDLHDLGGEFEFSPPADFRTWPPPPPDVDPRYLEELNIEDEMPMFEEWLQSQGG